MALDEQTKETLMGYDKDAIIDSIHIVLEKEDINKLISHLEQRGNSNEQQSNDTNELKECTDDAKENENREESKEVEQEEEDDSLQATLEYMKKYGFRTMWQKLDREEVKQMIDSQRDLQRKDYVILDVRTPQYDYHGGHIIGARNIPSNKFQAKLHRTVMECVEYKSVIIHCMYSQMRGPTCCNFYYNSLQELCKNYKDGTRPPQFQYSLRRLAKIFDQIDDEKYDKLFHQNIYLLEHGFSGMINECIKDVKQMEKYIQGYDASMWHMDDNVWCHKQDWHGAAIMNEENSASSSD